MSKTLLTSRKCTEQWADFVFLRCGRTAHVLPHLAPVFSSGRMAFGMSLCGRTPALFEEWLGTGNQHERDKALAMRLCQRCEIESGGRTR